MNPKRVPDLDWSTNLYRDALSVDVIDDPDNPFWEQSDFAPASQPAAHENRVPRRDYAMAA